jgi:hypothetical protein
MPKNALVDTHLPTDSRFAEASAKPHISKVFANCFGHFDRAVLT